MANNYSWSTANSKGYKTGNYNSVAGAITPLTRQTIADGNLLNSDITEVLSSRDKYIYDNINDLESKTDFVYTQVSTNSAEEWNNSKLSGFSAIKCDETTLTADKLNDVLNLETVGINSTINGTTVTLSVPSFYASSYMVLASAQLAPDPFTEDRSFIPFFTNKLDWKTYNATPLLFGKSNLPSKYDKALMIQSSKASNGGIAINGSTASNGIAINNSTNAGYTTPGISFNSSTAGTCSFACNNSTASLNCNFAINNSTATNDMAIAINGSTATGAGININQMNVTTNCTTLLGFAYGASLGELNGVAYFDSFAEFGGFAAYGSTGCAGVSLYGCTNDSTTLGLAMHNSYCNAASISLMNSSATDNCFAFTDSTAKSFGVAMYTAYSENQGVAMHLSSATSYGAAMFQYCSATQHAFTLYESSARAGSFAFEKSLAYDGCVALFSSSAFYGNFAAHNSITQNGCNNNNVAIYNSLICNTHSVSTAKYQSIGGSIAAYNSTLGYNSSLHVPSKVYSGTTCDGKPIDASTCSFGFAGIAKYDSMHGCSFGLAEYNSKIDMATIFNIAMYNSYVQQTNDAIYVKDAHGNITNPVSGCAALFDSTITNSANVVSLWRNSIKIEPHGYINGIKFIDLNVVTAIDYNEIGTYHALGKQHIIIG